MWVQVFLMMLLLLVAAANNSRLAIPTRRSSVLRHHWPPRQVRSAGSRNLSIIAVVHPPSGRISSVEENTLRMLVNRLLPRTKRRPANPQRLRQHQQASKVGMTAPKGAISAPNKPSPKPPTFGPNIPSSAATCATSFPMAFGVSTNFAATGTAPTPHPRKSGYVLSLLHELSGGPLDHWPFASNANSTRTIPRITMLQRICDERISVPGNVEGRREGRRGSRGLAKQVEIGRLSNG